MMTPVVYAECHLKLAARNVDLLVMTVPLCGVNVPIAFTYIVLLNG